jgi:hypothetical protein
VDQTACKPGSVPPPCGDAAIIPLDRPSRDGSRDLPGALGPTTALSCAAEASQDAGSLFGLAPGGACHAALVTKVPVRSYRTLSPLPWPKPRRSALCGAIPGVTPGGRYPPPCRRGARTFLDPLAETATAQPSDPRGPWSLRPDGVKGQCRLAALTEQPDRPPGRERRRRDRPGSYSGPA